MTSKAFEEHKAQHKRKLSFIDQILAAPGCGWSETELAALPLGDLTKIAALAAAAPRPMSRADPGLALPGSDDDYARCPPLLWG